LPRWVRLPGFINFRTESNHVRRQGQTNRQIPPQLLM
jgi:hypothetical protein